MSTKIRPLLRRGESYGDVMPVHDLLDVLPVSADNLPMVSLGQVKGRLCWKFLLQDAQSD